MSTERPTRLAVLCLLLAGLTWFSPRSAAAQTAHLEWAEDLVSNVTPEDNEYDGTPSLITWAGVRGARRYRNRTYCATFLTALLRQAYGWTDEDLEGWLGSSSPYAVTYHDAIVAGDGFRRIRAVDDIRAGDIVAIRYPASESSTGHIAIVRRAPRRRIATAPFVPGTIQFELSIVDSTSTPHGPEDSRSRDDDTGAGSGVMRLYANPLWNTLVGHSWSTTTSSVYYTTSQRSVVIGRLRLSRAVVSTMDDADESRYGSDGEP
jgi:hypothetical protein